MKFYVIYSFVERKGESATQLRPSRKGRSKLWHRAEKDYDIDYWQEMYDRKNITQEKWVTRQPLTRKEFDEFIDDRFMHLSCVDTGGSLTSMGMLPAISFDAPRDDIDDPLEANAYVTPLTDRMEAGEHVGDDRDFKRIKRAMWNIYR